jgi:type I restriction enzyme, S subunit
MSEELKPFGTLLAYPLRSGVTVPKESRGTGIRMVNMRELFKYPRLGAVDMERVTLDVADKDRFLLQEGDLLFARRSLTAEGAGKCCILISVPEETTWESSIIRARLAAEIVEPEFYYYFFSSDIGRRSVETIVEQVAAAGIRSSDLAKLMVPVPSLAKQRGIVSILRALDDKIAINDRIVSLSEQLPQAIFTDSFSDAIAFLTAGTKLPDGWRSGAFGDMCAVLETGRRPKGGVSGYADGVTSIGAESITRLAAFDFSKVKYVPEDYFAKMRQGIVEDYDILLYKDGGRPGNFEPHVSMFGRGFPFSRMCINEHVYRIRLRRPMSQAYGYFWLISEPIMTEMRSRGTGVAIPGLNSNAVRDLPVVCPPAERLSRFDACVVPLIDQALNAASESRALSQLRDTLLPRLMSGEIRVRDAEKVVEDVT